MNKCNKSHSPKKAFTLIELSIVLVIIGLIVGGVLVGQDLIQGAKLQRLQQSFTAFETSNYTFRLKYNEMAGDTTKAYQFFAGNTYCTNASDCNGNGDKQIDRDETRKVLMHLMYAGLITEGLYDTTSGGGSMTVPHDPKKTAFQIPYDNAGMVMTSTYSAGLTNLNCTNGSDRQLGNFYLATAMTAGNANVNHYTGINVSPFVSRTAAKLFDIKFDDGNGRSGQYFAYNNAALTTGGGYACTNSHSVCAGGWKTSGGWESTPSDDEILCGIIKWIK